MVQKIFNENFHKVKNYYLKILIFLKFTKEKFLYADNLYVLKIFTNKHGNQKTKFSYK